MSNSKIAVITGGNRGLGRNMAIRLARRGVNAIVTYRSHRAEADEACAEIQATGARAAAMQLDTGKVATFNAFARELSKMLDETWGRECFDYLINNAAFGINKSVEQTTEEEEFEGLADVQLKGVFFLTQRLLPMIEDGGRIVNISSGLGGIKVFTRHLAKERGPREITGNGVAPAAVEADSSGRAVRANPEAQRMVADVAAPGRTRVPDDIGPVIASLLSGDNRWITRQRIEVFGEMYL
jgi:NAD(P)-dependent dehydrogenase (short-subunit alcohol dehydrogenase family)